MDVSVMVPHLPVAVCVRVRKAVAPAPDETPDRGEVEKLVFEQKLATAL